jgi:hypothetical protein
MRWYGIFKVLSRDGGRSDFSKNTTEPLSLMKAYRMCLIPAVCEQEGVSISTTSSVDERLYPFPFHHHHQNEMLGAGIPMPAALVSMPMPSYVYKAVGLLKSSFCFTYFNAEFPSLIPLEYKPCNTTM